MTSETTNRIDDDDASSDFGLDAVENAILDSAAPSVDPNAYAEFEEILDTWERDDDDQSVTATDPDLPDLAPCKKHFDHHHHNPRFGSESLISLPFDYRLGQA